MFIIRHPKWQFDDLKPILSDLSCLFELECQNSQFKIPLHATDTLRLIFAITIVKAFCFVWITSRGF